MNESQFTLKKLDINTYNAPVIYIREDCHICCSEGFIAEARVKVMLGGKSLIATLNTVRSDILKHNEASLSSYAWDFLKATPGDQIIISHPRPLNSIGFIRSKLYGGRLEKKEIDEIISDLINGRLSDIHIAMFLCASAASQFSLNETADLGLLAPILEKCTICHVTY